MPGSGIMVGIMICFAYCVPFFFAGIIFTESFRRFGGQSKAFGRTAWSSRRRPSAKSFLYLRNEGIVVDRSRRVWRRGSSASDQTQAHDGLNAVSVKREFKLKPNCLKG